MESSHKSAPCLRCVRYDGVRRRGGEGWGGGVRRGWKGGWVWDVWERSLHIASHLPQPVAVSLTWAFKDECDSVSIVGSSEGDGVVIASTL